jgi:hypothetical protein
VQSSNTHEALVNTLTAPVLARDWRLVIAFTRSSEPLQADGPLFVTGLDGIQVHGPSPGTLPSRSFVYESRGERNYNKGQPLTADGFAHASSSSDRSFFERMTLMAAASSKDVDVHRVVFLDHPHARATAFSDLIDVGPLYQPSASTIRTGDCSVREQGPKKPYAAIPGTTPLLLFL